MRADSRYCIRCFQTWIRVEIEWNYPRQALQVSQPEDGFTQPKTSVTHGGDEIRPT